MTLLVCHPTGNENVRAVLRGLEQEGFSPAFFTTLALSRSTLKKFSFSSRLVSELGRRVFDELPSCRIWTMPWRELVRQGTTRSGLNELYRHETGWASVDAIYHALDRRVARVLRRGMLRPKLVYAYEDGALETFRESKRLGIPSVYELPLSYWRAAHQILGEEKELRPAWASTIDALRDSPAKLRRKDSELVLSDAVIVPSRFVAKSLELAPHRPKRVEIVPYGGAAIVDMPVTKRLDHEPLRIFYAGQLSQRKGLSYLFEALSRFEYPYELAAAGPLPRCSCKALEVALATPNHRWLGRLPRSRLLEEMTRSHVFVFPSLVEGLALVLGEAMACGLPIVATANSGAGELLREGSEGFIVPIRDPDAIVEKLCWLYENENSRYAMAEAAKRRAADRRWNSFEKGVAGLVRDMIT